MSSTDTGSTAPKKAEEDLERAKSAIANEASAAKSEMRQAGVRLRDEASGIAKRAKGLVSDQAHEGKETVASSMTDFAAAVRKASDELGERDQSMAANLVREVASGLEEASRAIHGRSVGDLTRSVSDFGRRQPAAFLLGATVAGVALGRFLKATKERPEEGGPGAGAENSSNLPNQRRLP